RAKYGQADGGEGRCAHVDARTALVVLHSSSLNGCHRVASVTCQKNNRQQRRTGSPDGPTTVRAGWCAVSDLRWRRGAPAVDQFGRDEPHHVRFIGSHLTLDATDELAYGHPTESVGGA